MDKAEFFQLEIWGWNCPHCGQDNEITKRPQGWLMCASCCRVFKAIEVEEEVE